MIQTTITVSNGGTPLLVRRRHDGKGVILTQGTSYLIVGTDEISALVQAIKDVSK